MNIEHTTRLINNVGPVIADNVCDLGYSVEAVDRNHCVPYPYCNLENPSELCSQFCNY